jgi:uncharacterized membrane protein YdjX (TVP38/TMEM64 family)
MQNRENKMSREEATLSVILVFLAIACLIMGILFIGELNYAWIQAHFIICAAIYAFLIMLICMVGIIFLFREQKTVSKLLLSVLVLLLFSVTTAFILQKTGFFEVVDDAESLQAYLEEAGVWMPLLYVLLQFLQVVLLPIPSLVSTVAGIALFGPLKTMIYSFVGIMAGSILAFYVGRKWGKRAASWMVGEETLSKWQKKLKRKDNLFLSVMFILPLFPDDVLCFLSGLSSMTFVYFLIVVSISRILAIATTCYSVNFIPFNTWWGILIWGLILTAILLLCVFVYKNMDKIQKKWKELRFKSKKNNK